MPWQVRGSIFFRVHVFFVFSGVYCPIYTNIQNIEGSQDDVSTLIVVVYCIVTFGYCFNQRKCNNVYRHTSKAFSRKSWSTMASWRWCALGVLVDGIHLNQQLQWKVETHYVTWILMLFNLIFFCNYFFPPKKALAHSLHLGSIQWTCSRRAKKQPEQKWAKNILSLAV